MSDIELAVVVEHWAIDVHLDDVCVLSFLNLRLVCIGISLIWFLYLFDDAVQFIDLIDNCDASALIAVLAWFHNPYISGFILDRDAFLLYLAFFFDDLGPPFVIVIKFGVFWILHPFFDVESQRQILIDIQSHQSVILPHVVKQGLFIA